MKLEESYVYFLSIISTPLLLPSSLSRPLRRLGGPTVTGNQNLRREGPYIEGTEVTLAAEIPARKSRGRGTASR